MRVKCIKDNDSGYVPVTSYKEGDIVDVNFNGGKYFDKKTSSELKMKYFIHLAEYRNNIIDNILDE